MNQPDHLPVLVFLSDAEDGTPIYDGADDTVRVFDDQRDLESYRERVRGRGLARTEIPLRVVLAAPDLLACCEEAQCGCSPAERDSGHVVGCWMPSMLMAIDEAKGSTMAASACADDRAARKSRNAVNTQLLDALERLVSAFPAFRAACIGAPGSEARARQDEQIAAEDAALAAIAQARGLSGLAPFPFPNYRRPPGNELGGERPLLGDTEPRRLSDDDLGGRAALEAAGLEPTDGWDDDRPTDEEVIDTMCGTGGGFVSRLGEAWMRADLDNRRRLKAAFPHYWDEYAKAAAERKAREAKGGGK